jgi:hypothetical protein
MSEIDLARYQDLTDEANDLIPLFLGALKLLDDFAVAASSKADTMRLSAVDGDRSNDPLVLAMLGLLSLRRTVRRWAGEAAGEHAAEALRRLEPPPPSPMLR